MHNHYTQTRITTTGKLTKVQTKLHALRKYPPPQDNQVQVALVKITVVTIT